MGVLRNLQPAKLKGGDKLQDLEKRMERVEAGGSGEAFELDDHAYPTSDFTNSVVKEKIPSSGLYWDLFSVLVNMWPKGQSGKDRADEQHSAERIKTSTLENNLLAAMSHSCPACLYAKGGVSVPVELEEGFGACGSYMQWISGVESLKKTLNKQMKDFTAGVLGNVDMNAGGALLAKALMGDVRAQWYEVVSWVGEFYKQLTEEANFKDKPAWRLVGRCVAAIFDSMNTARAKVALIKDPKPLENKTRIIWCVLQCHTIMYGFINLKFQGHPIIVKEITTMFMVTERVGPEGLVEL
jgi:hypothetical protein